MSSLESLVKTIETKKELIAQEKDLVNIQYPDAVRQKRGHINRAKEDLKDLYRDYRVELQKRAAFIIAIGGQSKKFADLAEKEFGCFSLDAEILYKEIGEQIPTPVYMNKAASPSLFDHFGARFGDRALEIDIIGHRPLSFNSKYSKMLKSTEDMVKLMRTAFNETIGSEVVGLDAIDRVSIKAVNEGYASKTVPIVLYTKDEEFAADLATNLKKVSINTFIVSTGAKVSDKIKNASLATARTVSNKNLESVLVKVKENLR